MAIIIGAIFAFLTSLWLRKIPKDEIQIIVIVVASLYLMMWFLIFTNYGTSRGVTLLVFT